MINHDYKYSSKFKNWNDFTPTERCAYFYASSPEERSDLVHSLKKKKNKNQFFLGIENLSRDRIKDMESGSIFQLRSKPDMAKLLSQGPTNTVYIDTSGMNARICAALLRNVLEISNDVRIIYAEPEFYKIKEFQTAGYFNDLSEIISGIEPLPGFASIIPPRHEKILMVPLLGFEGGRFTHIREKIQPLKNNILPIIGVPGFRAEYPFVAYWGNKHPLRDSGSWRKAKYVVANSIIDTFITLKKTKQEYSDYFLKVAPIGTKPHAIGAILFAFQDQNHSVELVYDNPIRTKRRTEGIGKIIECHVSKLLEDYRD